MCAGKRTRPRRHGRQAGHQGRPHSPELVLPHRAENRDLDGFFAAFPRLTREEVKACLAYAHLLMARE